MGTKLTFSIRSLQEIQPPKEGRLYLSDDRQPGLQICITAKNARTFLLYKKVHGRPKRIKIGRLGEITVEQARDRAKKMVAAIADGIDPMAERKSARTQPTLSDLAKHWIEKHAKPRKKSWAEDERLKEKHLGTLKPRRLSTIKRSDIASLHSDLGEKCGHYLANRVLSLLSSMFGKAHEIGYEGANPTKGVVKFKEESRARFLEAGELPAFFEAVKAYPDETLRDFFLVALLTGARRGNVQAMRWADLDLEWARWRIPDTKSGQSVDVHLSEFALEVLCTRQDAANGSPWVFPGHKKGTHLKEPKAAWKAIITAAGIKDLRIHDLRRTLGSWQALLGSSLPIIGKSLGHKSTASTAVYARLGIKAVGESVNNATAAIMAASEKKQIEVKAEPATDAITKASKPAKAKKTKGAK